jgi:hypothetical protein
VTITRSKSAAGPHVTKLHLSETDCQLRDEIGRNQSCKGCQLHIRLNPPNCGGEAVTTTALGDFLDGCSSSLFNRAVDYQGAVTYIQPNG